MIHILFILQCWYLQYSLFFNFHLCCRQNWCWYWSCAHWCDIFIAWTVLIVWKLHALLLIAWKLRALCSLIAGSLFVFVSFHMHIMRDILFVLLCFPHSVVSLYFLLFFYFPQTTFKLSNKKITNNKHKQTRATTTTTVQNYCIKWIWMMWLEFTISQVFSTLFACLRHQIKANLSLFYHIQPEPKLLFKLWFYQ